jgi:hypothetical protein
MELYPLAISTNGRHHPHVAKFVSVLAERWGRTTGVGVGIARQRLVQSLSVTLHRANGAMLVKVGKDLAMRERGDGGAVREQHARPWRGRVRQEGGGGGEGGEAGARGWGGAARGRGAANQRGGGDAGGGGQWRQWAPRGGGRAGDGAAVAAAEAEGA